MAASFLLLSDCADRAGDPAGEAGLAPSTRTITVGQIAQLPGSISLAEFQEKFGPGESQPGPRSTYRAAGQAGKFYWVYTDQKAGTWMIDHIVLANRIEEDGQLVWTAK